MYPEIIGYEIRRPGSVVQCLSLFDVAMWFEGNDDYGQPSYEIVVVVKDSSGGYWDLSPNEKRELFLMFGEETEADFIDEGDLSVCYCD